MWKKRRWILLLVLAIAALVIWRVESAGVQVKKGSYLLIPLDGSYVEEPPSDLLGKLVRTPPRTMIDLLRAIQIAAVDERVAGILLQVGSLDVGWAKSDDIRNALAEFETESGKPVLAVLEEEAASANKEYFVASIANRVYVSPASTAPLVGLAAQYFFLGGVWEKIDVQMNVLKIREYKTFGDMLVNKKMSPYHREMANSILDSIDGHFVSAIAEARHLDPLRVRAIIDDGPSTAPRLQQEGLTDGVKYLADVRHEDTKDAPVIKLDDYTGVDLSAVGLTPKSAIAVVYGVGAIVSGESGNALLQGPLLGAQTVIDAFKDAADSDAKAIVFRVDSPGGSALASDLIWKAIEKAKEKKPVIVSMSDVAGSGGYYVTAGASRILAQPTTLTGSIGVVFARPTVSGLLERLGITTETLSRGKYARLNDLTTPFDDTVRQKMLAEIEHIYQVFVDRVAAGRKLTPARVNEIGRGRVWTGEQAAANGLVDQIGGFIDAIRAAKVASGLKVDEPVELSFYPRHKSIAERLAEALSSRAEQLDMPWRDELRAALALTPFHTPGPLTLMPQVVSIH